MWQDCVIAKKAISHSATTRDSQKTCQSGIRRDYPDKDGYGD